MQTCLPSASASGRGAEGAELVKVIIWGEVSRRGCRGAEGAELGLSSILGRGFTQREQTCLPSASASGRGAEDAEGVC